MKALTIFAVAIIVASVTLVTEARPRTCNRRAFWKQVYNKNNRIGWDDFVNHIAGGSYLNTYAVYKGEALAHVGKAQLIYSATTDMTVNTLVGVFLVEESTCRFYNVTFTRTDRKTCKYGLETYLELGTTVTVGPNTFPVQVTMYSQDPAKYFLQIICFNVAANGTCSSAMLSIQIRDTRVSPAPGDEIDLSSVPWDKVAYDLYKLTGLKFGDAEVIYTWLGTDCPPTDGK